jgi:predicted esterase
VRAYLSFFSFLFGLALFLSAGVCEAKSVRSSAPKDPERLELEGGLPEAFYFAPRVRGARPVIMFLHGRGGNPQEDCRKWAPIATQFGWLVCPQGPEDRGGGSRAWQNNVAAGQSIIDASIAALRAKYKNKVRSRDSVLIGFSEGAFLAMQIGLHKPERWNRWLIVAANDQYWFGDTEELLKEKRRKIRRVYLLTGDKDEVAENTKRVGDTLRAAKVPVRVKIAEGLGHELPSGKMTTFRKPLRWLTAG